MKQEHQKILLDIARATISNARKKTLPGLKALPQELQEYRATFVTLTIDKHLRGCIGMLEACRPLALDVADNAYAAAFEDPRFQPLTHSECPNVHIHISILSPPDEMSFASERDLLAKIRPGVDGLILEECGRRGTFLPSVWEELPDPDMFLKHLKMKASLPADYWSDTIRIFRYTTTCFGGRWGTAR